MSNACIALIAAAVVVSVGLAAAQAEEGLPSRLPAAKPAESTTQPAKGTWRGTKYIPSWETCHQAYKKRAQKGGIELLFVGDSLTWAWQNHKAVWKKYYGKYRAEHFGIVSDKVQHLLYRLQNGELENITPKVIVVLIGGNSLGHTPKAITAGIKANVDTIRRKLPKTKVLVMGMLPMDAEVTPRRLKIKQTNALTAKLDDGKMVRYIDIGDKFVKPDDSLDKDLYSGDKIHLGAKGYEVWASSIEPILKEMMSDQPATAPTTAPAPERSPR